MPQTLHTIVSRVNPTVLENPVARRLLGRKADSPDEVVWIRMHPPEGNVS